MPLFSMYWRRSFKRPTVIVLWTLMPFIFMTIYALVFGRSGKIAPAVLALVDEDSTYVSKLLRGSLSYGSLQELLSVKEVSNLDAAQALFKNGKASAALVIPKHFGSDLLLQKDVELKFYTNPRHAFSPQILKGVTETFVTIGNGFLHLFAAPVEAISTFVEHNKEPNADDIADISKLFFTAGKTMEFLSSLQSLEVRVMEEKGQETSGFNMGIYFFPGLVVFALLSLSLGVEARFLTDKMNKLNNLIIASPTSPAILILSQRLYAVVFLYFISIICAIIGALLWRIPPVGLFKVNIMAIGLILFIVGLNATIFSIAKTQKAGGALSSFIMVILIMIGGGMFPVEFYPAAVQKIAHFTPTGLANTGIVECLTGRDVSISIPLLLVYCLTFFSISIAVGRRRFVES